MVRQGKEETRLIKVYLRFIDEKSKRKKPKQTNEFRLIQLLRRKEKNKGGTKIRGQMKDAKQVYTMGK